MVIIVSVIAIKTPNCTPKVWVPSVFLSARASCTVGQRLFSITNEMSNSLWADAQGKSAKTVCLLDVLMSIHSKSFKDVFSKGSSYLSSRNITFLWNSGLFSLSKARKCWYHGNTTGNINIYIYRLIHRYMWIEWSSTTPTTIDFRQKLRLCFKHPQSLLSTAFPRLQGAVTWCFLPWWRRHRDPWPERWNTQRHRGQPYHHLKNWGIRQSKQKEYALYIKYPQ